MLGRMTRLMVIAALVAAATPAIAGGAADFLLVTGTGSALAELQIRRAGTEEWKPLGPAPSAGARTSLKFRDPDCAFDLRATAPGSGPVTWTGVNLCGAKSVTLLRDGSTGAWVDYDQ